MRTEHRVVLSLASAQALVSTSAVLLMTIGGLAGLELAPCPALATLPIAMLALGTAITTIPASLITGRIGRRPGFLIGAMLGIAGGLIAAWGALTRDFILLCLGAMCVGGYQGFTQFYRFAAAEAASASFKSRALSLVLTGGIIAALAGPHLGALTRDMLAAPFAGSFVAVAALGVVAVAVLVSTPFAPPEAAAIDDAPARPLTEIARQPRFIAAVGGAAIGYAVMVTVMTATPLSMVEHHHSVGDAATVIQWHVLGMFVPSFFTGTLIRRLGIAPLMLTGVVFLAVHVLIAFSGSALANFISALIFLGLGWNLLFVGGSALLTETYRPAERAKVQALNDFTIVGVTAIGSFSAGALNQAFGWEGLNLFVLPFLAVAALLILLAGRPVPAAV